ncbi:hypothetical protein IWQ56_003817, partial [Coemansia nantahalensis]
PPVGHAELLVKGSAKGPDGPRRPRLENQGQGRHSPRHDARVSAQGHIQRNVVQLRLCEPL